MALKAFARGIATAFATFSAVSGCTAAYGERVREQVHQSIAAGDSPALEIENIAGSVQVEGWPRPLVGVQATRYGYDAEELHGVKVSGIHGGGTIGKGSGRIHLETTTGAIALRQR